MGNDAGGAGLLYNTRAARIPAHRENQFNHIMKLFAALRWRVFDVTINLLHNGKIVCQYRAVPKAGQTALRRDLRHRFSNKRWRLNGNGDLTLRGWVADPNHTTPRTGRNSVSLHQRSHDARSPPFNHAIRQAGEEQTGVDQHPAFVLYLEIDPHQVDVNVHPAKHEVRFHQSRLVHDFIYQGVLSVLQQQLETLHLGR
ncbi:hypothetical protein ACNKHM_09240 [Shigella sonnei]